MHRPSKRSYSCHTIYVKIYFIFIVAAWVLPPEHPNTPTHKGQQKLPKDKNVFLYDIPSDPYELVDLSDKYPDVVQRLLKKLEEYDKTSVPVVFPKEDPASRPSLHNGAWVPWR